MKAYNCECECGVVKDRIFKTANDLVRCPEKNCNRVMKKMFGPIGGSNILPTSPSEKDRFVPYKSESLGKVIASEVDMMAAYNEMYSINPMPNDLKDTNVAKKVLSQPLNDQLNQNDDDEDGEEEDDDDDVDYGDIVDSSDEIVSVKKTRGRPSKKVE